MKKYGLIAMAVLSVAGPVYSMPTKKELAEVGPLVDELMRPLVGEYKAGKKRAAEVGDGAMVFVAEAESEAAKLMLLKGAIHYYSREREYDKIADAVAAIVGSIQGMPPDELYEIAKKASAGATKRNAPRLVALNNILKVRGIAVSRLRANENELSAKPGDSRLLQMHAELVAAAGDWDVALEEFSKLGGDAAAAASAELDNSGELADAAAFWWDYKPAAAIAKSAVREHAVDLYRKALDSGEIKGLNRVLAERRIEEAGNPEILPICGKSGRGPGRGLVGYWKFNGNAKDSSGNGNHGSVCPARGEPPAQNPAATLDRFGREGMALRFNIDSPVRCSIQVPDSPSLRNIKKAFTICAWIKPAALDYRDWLSVMQKGDQKQCQYGWFVNMRKAGITFFNGVGGVHKIDARHRWTLNEWQFGVIVYEYGKEARVYRNGELAGSAKADFELAVNDRPLCIGSDPFVRTEYFIGDMDDVRLYNRALDEKEVADLYKKESTPPKTLAAPAPSPAQ